LTHYLFLDAVCRLNDVIDIWTHMTVHSKMVTDFVVKRRRRNTFNHCRWLRYNWDNHRLILDKILGLDGLNWMAWKHIDVSSRPLKSVNTWNRSPFWNALSCEFRCRWRHAFKPSYLGHLILGFYPKSVGGCLNCTSINGSG
jgi:hypothetical protein